jgi:5,10-methylenetetrahydromethanopterin reductase
LNRWDYSTPAAFAEDVRHAESLGWGHALLGANALRVWDPYVMLALAAQVTRDIRLSTFVDNAVVRHPAVLANSIASVDQVSDGRAELAVGVGDTAVRFLGRSPQRVAELERSVLLMRELLRGASVDFGGRQPVRMRVARPVPVWIAAGGPKTLRAAGASADGVYIRVGRDPGNLRAALAHVHAGAEEAGRDPESVRIGLVLHTLTSTDPAAIRAMSRSIAAGFYEYSTVLFDGAGLEWNGPDIHELHAQVWPDFHHADDLVAAGALVDFLPEAAARAFSCFGTPAEIAEQYVEAIEALGRVDVVVPHPVPSPPSAREFAEWFTQKVWSEA